MCELMGETLSREDVKESAPSMSGRRSALHPRRWLRISLRGLMIAVALLCVYLAWMKNRVQREHDAVTELVRRGYIIQYPGADGTLAAKYSLEAPLPESNGLFGPGWENFGRPTSIIATEDFVSTDSLLFANVSQLAGISVKGKAFGDDELRRLLAPRTVTGLALDHCALTAASIDVLKNHDELRVVLLCNTLISKNAQAELFRALPQCDIRFEEHEEPFTEEQRPRRN